MSLGRLPAHIYETMDDFVFTWVDAQKQGNNFNTSTEIPYDVIAQLVAHLIDDETELLEKLVSRGRELYPLEKVELRREARHQKRLTRRREEKGKYISHHD